jgi:hypothetical protein
MDAQQRSLLGVRNAMLVRSHSTRDRIHSRRLSAPGRARSIFAAWRSTIIPGARDGVKIYTDKPWTFAKLPEYLIGADFIQVVNHGGISAAEGYIYTVFKPGIISNAYDELNPALPMNDSRTAFSPTGDAIIIAGHRHRIYQSPPVKVLDQL